MKKIMFLLLLVLFTIFLFAGSGTPATTTGNLKKVTERADNPASENNQPISTAENIQTPVTQPEQGGHSLCRLSLFSKENDIELWIQSEQEDRDKIIGLDLQMYNSNGERVYSSKFQSNLEKINLSKYKSGKYTVRVGDQSYNIMII